MRLITAWQNVEYNTKSHPVSALEDNISPRGPTLVLKRCFPVIRCFCCASALNPSVDSTNVMSGTVKHQMVETGYAMTCNSRLHQHCYYGLWHSVYSLGFLSQHLSVRDLHLKIMTKAIWQQGWFYKFRHIWRGKAVGVGDESVFSSCGFFLQAQGNADHCAQERIVLRPHWPNHSGGFFASPRHRAGVTEGTWGEVVVNVN